MLSKEAITCSIPLAEMMAGKGLVVNSKPNTVLSELDRVVNSLFLQSTINQPAEFDAAAFAQLIETVTFSYENPTPHDQAMDELVSKLVPVVQSHLFFTRNVVKPVVLHVGEEISQYIQGIKTPSPEEQFSLDVFNLPELLTDAAMVENISVFSDIKDPQAYMPSVSYGVEAFTDQTLLDYILTGDQVVDGLITEWFSKTEPNTYSDYINSVFSDGARPDVFQVTNVSTQNINRVLICYLVASALFNKEDRYSPALSELSEAARSNIIADYRKYYGGYLCAMMALAKNYEQAGLLVMYMNQDDRCIVVYGPVFSQWLNTGGKTEHLMALMSLGMTNVRTLEAVQKLHDRLESEWQSYTLFWENMHSNTRFNQAKTGISMIFSADLQNLTPQEQEYMKTHTDYLSNIETKLSCFVDGLKPSDLNNPYDLALRLVSQCRFYFSEAEFILSEIEDICKTHPNIKAEEAATIATVHYIVDYMCDQMSADTIA